MGHLNAFLAIAITVLTFGIPFIVIPSEGGTLEEKCAYLISLIFCVFSLVHSMFAQKSFHLGETSLHIETRLLFAKWHLTLPRETITHLRQVKDGGEGRDSFPSWGLKIRSVSDTQGFLGYIIFLIHLRRDTRYRSLLFRLPYEHSYWLGIVVARWANARLDLSSRY
jgi:hypothetical protein